METGKIRKIPFRTTMITGREFGAPIKSEEHTVKRVGFISPYIQKYIRVLKC